MNILAQARHRWDEEVHIKMDEVGDGHFLLNISFYFLIRLIQMVCMIHQRVNF